jgi:hypothetical protein
VLHGVPLAWTLPPSSLCLALPGQYCAKQPRRTHVTLAAVGMEQYISSLWGRRGQGDRAFVSFVRR